MVGWVSSDLRFTVALLPLYEGVRFQLLYSVKKRLCFFSKKLLKHLAVSSERSTFALAFKKESGRKGSRGDRQQKEIFEGI